MNPANKQYGLIIPKQQRKTPLLQRPVFVDDDDLDDDEDESEFQMPRRKGPMLIPTQSKTNLLQKAEIKNALKEDPNVFSYDDVYDDMKNASTSETSKKKEPQMPKYMPNLMKSAERRKREQEAREERKIQKEREREGDEFTDKEAFVTSAYKEKLRLLKEAEEREKAEMKYEEIMDVKKQKDLSGFYRHFLNQQIGEEKASDASVTNDRFQSTSSSETSTKDSSTVTFNRSRPSQRKIRRRVSDDKESDDDEKLSEKIVDEGDIDMASHAETLKTPKKVSETVAFIEAEPSTSAKLLESTKDPDDECMISVKESKSQELEKPKVDRNTLILQRFKKRTIGPAFEAALERYKERKTARNSVE